MLGSLLLQSLESGRSLSSNPHQSLHLLLNLVGWELGFESVRIPTWSENKQNKESIINARPGDPQVPKRLTGCSILYPVSCKNV